MASDSLKVVVTAAVKDAIRDLGLVDKQINKTAGAAEVWSKKLGSYGSSLSKNLTLPIAAAAIASVKFAADIEKQNLAFGVLLRDTAKGTALFESLKKFSAETPLELEDITKGAQTLLAFGVSAADVKDELQMLGDAAQGDGARLESLVSAYGKVRANGKASLEELNRFTENGVPIVEALANGYGVTTSELLKMVSAGKVGFPQVQAAMEKLTGKGGLFEDMMKRMSQTTAGKFSPAMDNLKLSAAELGTTLLPIANQTIDKVGKMAEKFSSLDEGSKKAILTMAGIAALAGPVASTASSMLSLAAAVSKINWASMAGFLAKIGPAGIVVGATVGLAAAIDKSYTNKINSDVGFRHEAIAQDLHLAEKTFDVYKRIAESYGESLDTVIAIAKQNKYISDEEERQLRLQADSVKYDAARKEYYEMRVQASKAAPADASTSDVFDETTKSWQQWWQEITGSDVVGVAGEEAARTYVQTVIDGLKGDKDLAEALGETFDIKGALEGKAEEVKKVLRALLSIDPKSIDSPFTLADGSVKTLIGSVKDLIQLIAGIPEAAVMDPVILAHSQLDDLISDENAKLMESTRLWSLYYEVQLEINDVATDPARLAALISINEQLRDQLGITKQVTDEIEKAKSESAAMENLGKNIGQVLIDSVLPAIEAIAEQAWSGKGAMDGMDEVIASQAASILKNIAPYFLKAGLETIGFNFPAGVILLGMSGLFALGGSLFQSYASTPDSAGSATSDAVTGDIGAVITDTGQIVIDTAERVADAEEELRRQQLEDLKKHMDLEADVLKDAWDRNLITTAQYIQSLTDMNDAYMTAAGGYKTLTTPGYTFDPTKRAVYAAAGGADFVTAGPRMMMVGDNPGGRERVTVTPLPAPGGGGGGQTVNQFIIASPTYGIEDLTEKMAQIWDRLERRRRIPS